MQDNKGKRIESFCTELSITCALDMSNISRFLNRILGVEVNLQNTLFAYFVETLNTVIAQAKKAKAWDEGILGK